MKVTKLTVKNVGIIEDAAIDIDKPEIVFFGDIKQGKSTLLNAVRWVCGGAFPADIIRHGQTEASVQLEGIDGNSSPWCIRREWYRGKDGTTRAREIVYTRNGVPIKKPVTEIQRHLNPFLLDQDYLRKMNPLERSRYLVELFAVDTSEQDGIIREAERQASELRVKVKAYGNIDLNPVERVDVSSLEERRRGLIADHHAKVAEAKNAIDEAKREHEKAAKAVDEKNAAIRQHNANVDRTEHGIARVAEEIAEMTQRLAEAKAKHEQAAKWLKANQRRPELNRPTPPDTSAHEGLLQTAPDTAEIDAAIRDAGATNVRAEQYAKNKQRAAARAADEKELTAIEKLIREQRKAKVDKLAEVGQQTGIPGLSFTDTGFTFDGADSSMLSDSQIMRLSQSLSAKYPEGFGLSMIDRGESLGKSVLTLWQEAQQREATILVTVVGDKPATIPEEVGAYVVESGKVSQ